MKSFFLNLVALALFAAAAAAAGILTTETLLFQLVAQWLVSELWFAAYLVPALLMQLFGRKGEERAAVRQRRAARWTSFCLLLIPAVLFGILSLAESLSSNALRHWLGLPLGGALYTCSFAGFLLLFILSLFTGAAPLSVQAALEQLLDDKVDEAREGIRAEAARSALATPPPLPAAGSCNFSGIPSRHSRLFEAHQRDVARMLQEGEQLLFATAPAGEVPAGDEMQSYLFGGGFGAAGLFLLSNACSLQRSGELSGLALWAFCIMGGAFLLAALPLLVTPLRRRRRLRSIDYFITDRRLLIYRGDEVHTQPWNEPCVCYLTPRAGSCGDIAVIRKGLGYHILRGFFKRWARLNEEETRNSFDNRGSFNNGKDMQTQALINVEGAEAIHACITELLAGRQPARRGAGGAVELNDLCLTRPFL